MTAEEWGRIQEIFLAAADLKAAEQGEFLNHACGTGTDLRREVETLLECDRKNGAGISEAVETAASAMLESPRPGETLGAYRILREIGRGGMGTVYLAERSDDQYRKLVAIKVVKRGMDTADVLARFRYERQILANLDHPYIARLHDGGTTADGRPFFVMEFVEGQTVDAFCRERRLEVKGRCRLFLRICEAVAYAHRNLVVHRDLKPGNILIAGDGTPKLLDFGVAKLLDGEADARTVLQTRPFTPDYASPEQVRGLPVTTSTDIYSLGAVLYELLAGQGPHPITGRTAVAVERAVCEAEIARPRAMAPQLDPDLENIIMFALRKEPDRRYQSVDQFAEDIRRYLEGRAVLACEDTFVYRARKFLRRHWWEAAAGFVVFASLTAATAISLVQSRRAEGRRVEAVRERLRAQAESRSADAARRAEAEQRRVAEQQGQEAERQRGIAEQRISELVDLANRTLFDVHSAIEPLPGAVAARRKIIKTTLDYLERLEKDSGQDERVRVALSDAYLKIGKIQGDAYGPSMGDFEGARLSFAKAGALLAPFYATRSGDSGLMLRWISIQYHSADLVYRAGKSQAAVEIYESLLPLAHRLGSTRTKHLESAEQEALIYGRLALVLHYSEVAKALRYSDREIALLKNLTERFPEDTGIKQELGSALGVAAGTWMRQGELERAAELYRESIELREELLAADANNISIQRSLMVSYGNYGGVLGIPWLPNLGRAEEARVMCDKAVAIARRLRNADPQDATARIDLAVSLSHLGSVDPGPDGAAASLRLLREAIELLAPAYKTNPASSSIAGHISLAREYAGHRLQELGRMAEAEAEYRESLAEAEPFLKSGNSSIAVQALAAEESLALLYLVRGERAAAFDFAGRALKLAQAQTGVPLPDDNSTGHLARAWFVLAQVQSKFGDADAAREMARNSIAAWNRIRNRSVLAYHRKAIEDASALANELGAR